MEKRTGKCFQGNHKFLSCFYGLQREVGNGGGGNCGSKNPERVEESGKGELSVRMRRS